MSQVAGGSPDPLKAEFLQAANEVDAYAKQRPGFFERKKYLVMEEGDGGKKLVCRTLSLREIWDAKRNPDTAAAKITTIARYLEDLQGRVKDKEYKDETGKPIDAGAMKAQFADAVQKFLGKQIKVEKMDGDDVAAATQLVGCFQPGQLEKSGEKIAELITTAVKNKKHDQARLLLSRLPAENYKDVFKTDSPGIFQLLKYVEQDSEKQTKLKKLDEGDRSEKLRMGELVTVAANAGDINLAYMLFNMTPRDQWADVMSQISTNNNYRFELLEKCINDDGIKDDFNKAFVKHFAETGDKNPKERRLYRGFFSRAADRSPGLLLLIDARSRQGDAQATKLSEYIQGTFEGSEHLRGLIAQQVLNAFIGDPKQITKVNIQLYAQVISNFDDREKLALLTTDLQKNGGENLAQLVKVCFGNLSQLTDTQYQVVAMLASDIDASIQGTYDVKKWLTPVRNQLVDAFPPAKIAVLMGRREANSVAFICRQVIGSKNQEQIRALFGDNRSVAERIHFLAKLKEELSYDAGTILPGIIAQLDPSDKAAIKDELTQRHTAAHNDFVWYRDHQGEKDYRSWTLPEPIQTEINRREKTANALRDLLDYFQ